MSSNQTQSTSFTHFHPEHVLLREVAVGTKDRAGRGGDKGDSADATTTKNIMCPVSDIQGFLLAASIEDKLTTEWAGMVRSSKNFQAKEKYRFFDSAKYKPLIRKGLPFSRRPEMWKRLCNPGVEELKMIVFEDVWRRAFRWGSLKPPSLTTAGASAPQRPRGLSSAEAKGAQNTLRSEAYAPASTAGKDSPEEKDASANDEKKKEDEEKIKELKAAEDKKRQTPQARMRAISVNYKVDDRFIPLFPPCFGSATYGVFQRLPILFSLSETAVTNLRYLLCCLAEANPEVKVAPLLPGLLAALLTQLSVHEAFDAAHGLIYLSKDTHLVETRVQYLRLSTVTYDATIRSMIHFIQGRAPEVVTLLQDKVKLDMQVLIHHLFSEFFANIVPLCVSLRIVDIFVNEGEKILYRVGLALFAVILPGELKALPETKEAFEHFFATFKVTDPAKLNQLFVTAFEYSFSRDTSKSVEAKYTKPEEVLHQLYPDPKNVQELRSRPEVFPYSGGSILTRPRAWEPVFGFLNSPKLHEAAFLPSRVERIFFTGEHGWSLSTMYRQCVQALTPFPKEGYNVRGLLLVRGSRVNPDAPEGTYENGEEVIAGACLHPLPDGQSFSGGGNNKYQGAPGSFIFGILPHKEPAPEAPSPEAKPTHTVPAALGAGASIAQEKKKEKIALVAGTMSMTHNSVKYSKYDRDYSAFYRYAGEPVESLESPRRKVKFGENKIHHPEEEVYETSRGRAHTISLEESGSTSCSPTHSKTNPPENSLHLHLQEQQSTTFANDEDVNPEEESSSGDLTRVQSMRREDAEDEEENLVTPAKGERSGEVSSPTIELHNNNTSIYSLDTASPPVSPKRSSLKGSGGSSTMINRFPGMAGGADRLLVETEEKPVNSYFWMMESENFTVGGGTNGGAALRLTSDLHEMTSMQCQTFDSPSLLDDASTEAGAGCKLAVGAVELWAIIE